jgi:ATP-dependent DNA helicase RecQ
MKNKSQLKQFLIEALWAYHLKKDCIVLQATGFGKSTCFHIPAMMLKRNQIGLIVVPTILLGEDHKQTLEEMGIQSVFLKASSDRKEYHVILQPKEVVSNPEQASKPAVVIMLPEFLFENDNHKGIIDRIDTNRVKFITLDEAHLTFEWVTFRKSFEKLQGLKDTFTCLIMALSATMKPEHLSTMCSVVLQNPALLKGTVERSNVDIHIVPYHHSSKKETIEDGLDDCFATANQIVEIIGEEKTILYCSFASECELLKSNFLQLGVKCEKYTGKTTSAKDKIAVSTK